MREELKFKVLSLLLHSGYFDGICPWQLVHTLHYLKSNHSKLVAVLGLPKGVLECFKAFYPSISSAKSRCGVFFCTKLTALCHTGKPSRFSRKCPFDNCLTPQFKSCSGISTEIELLDDSYNLRSIPATLLQGNPGITQPQNETRHEEITIIKICTLNMSAMLCTCIIPEDPG